MFDTDKKKIIIEGITESGEIFRPSDWAERISGELSTFKNRRILYSPLLQPITREGHKCVMVDPALKKSHPAIYNAIMDFARVNKLKICKE